MAVAAEDVAAAAAAAASCVDVTASGAVAGRVLVVAVVVAVVVAAVAMARGPWAVVLPAAEPMARVGPLEKMAAGWVFAAAAAAPAAPVL